jgi:tetratricopeptide (TPR) repeat protein
MRYEYILGCGEIYARDVEDFSGLGTSVWNKIIKNAPWMSPISPTMFKATKLMSSDWQETYAVDEQTGRNCVFVTGSYKPLKASFWTVFDLESKLMVRAKYWLNPHRKGTPAVDIEKISYDEEIADEIFNPEKFAEAKVINKEEREKRYALFRQANQLAAKKQYRESIEIFSQLYEKYPHFIKTPVALQYIGECYRILGQHEKAIEFFEKVLREYSAPKKAIADAYRLLGYSYMSIEQNNKALENFKMCLDFITQWDPEGMRYSESHRKQVEENIEKLKNKNK